MDGEKFEYFISRTEKDFEGVNENFKTVHQRFDQVFLELQKAQKFEVRVTAIVGLITVILAPTITLLTLYLKSH